MGERRRQPRHQLHRAQVHILLEALAQREQQLQMVRRMLKGVSQRDREVLRRFYVDGQAQEEICAAMGLSFNQYRLLKSRAKARFRDMTQRALQLAGRRSGGSLAEGQK